MVRPFLFLLTEDEYESLMSDLEYMADVVNRTDSPLMAKLKDQHDRQLTENRGIEEYRGNTADLPEAEI